MTHRAWVAAAVLGIALAACAPSTTSDDGPDRAGTRTALAATLPAVRALDGVAEADLSMDEELGVSLPSALRVRLVMTTDDRAEVGAAMREAARLVWASDVPEIGSIAVAAETPDGVLVTRVDDVWAGTAFPEDLTEQFGPRGEG